MSKLLNLEFFCGCDLSNQQFVKYVVLCLCLIAPPKVTLPLDGKIETATGKTFCLKVNEEGLL